MSNTLIAWAAFYPVLRAAFGGRPDGARKSVEGLNFPGFCRVHLAARQAVRLFLPLASPSQKRFILT
ncbi:MULTISPECIES: hypothetical protein [Pseudomonas]|uniref:Uncharacterized protein n=1 Tax=Pseudomonas wuhanensis TaxID=2954098 RepID=A0ABY9GVS4_9PSED|nr:MULTISPECIES: hypothetical protein [unclassified Pseudomonas]WLI14004.1 hypothetical protein PSH65_07685 [Pseudomonas sp. FP603]WLI19906.1 hypothetical protein PSH88_07695 [Pseudomonas sp. FP607]